MTEMQKTTADSFVNHEIVPIFRALSQRKRQGILQVSADEGRYQLSFYDGKIVSIVREDEAVARAIVERLARAQLLSAEIQRVIGNVELNVQQAYAFLVGKGHVAEEDFIRAKACYELDLVHSLRFLSRPEIKFTPKVIKRDGEIGGAIYPCQALLDVLELECDEGRYEELFVGEGITPILLFRDKEEARGLTASELAIWEVIGDFSTAEDIFERTLLSVYEIKEALLSLYDQQLISLSDHLPTDEPQEVAPAVLPENSVRIAPKQEDVLVLAPEGAVETAMPIEFSRAESTQYFSNEQAVEQTKSLKSVIAGNQKVDNTRSPITATEPKPVSKAEHASFSRSSGSSFVTAGRSNEGEVYSSDGEITFGEEAATPEEPDKRLENPPKLVPLNITQVYSAVSIVVFLLSLAILGPIQLNTWFAALRAYVSSE